MGTFKSCHPVAASFCCSIPPAIQITSKAGPNLRNKSQRMGSWLYRYLFSAGNKKALWGVPSSPRPCLGNPWVSCPTKKPSFEYRSVFTSCVTMQLTSFRTFGFFIHRMGTRLLQQLLSMLCLCPLSSPLGLPQPRWTIPMQAASVSPLTDGFAMGAPTSTCLHLQDNLRRIPHIPSEDPQIPSKIEPVVHRVTCS